MADKKITQLTDGGAPQATDEFVIARAGDNFKLDFASLDQATLDQAVILAPASPTRNIIQPTVDDAPLGLIGNAVGADQFDLFTLAASDSPSNVFRVDGAGSVLIRSFVNNVVLWQIRSAIGVTPNEFVVIRDDDFGDLFKVGPTGIVTVTPSDAAVARIILSGGTLPADGGFTASQLGLWYDATNGAAKFMLKGKTADGTVVTWAIPSFPGGTTLFLRADGTFAAPPSGAPTTATYITQTPDATLSAEQALSLLATGLLKNTTTTGVLVIAAQGTDYWAPGGTDVAVADGGTGASTAAGARTNLGLVIDTDIPSEASVVLKSLYDANSILAATTDDTPVALTIGASTFVGRKAAGGIVAMTVAEALTLLGSPYVPGGTDVPVTDGGTGSSTAAGARTNLGAAPLDATYITQTANSELSGEQALAALATGILKSTTTTGVLSIAAQGTDYYAPGGTDVAVADGGTGASTAATGLSNLGGVAKSLFDANTVLAADTDDTPAAVTMGASTILARLAAGNIKAATPAELRTLLDVPTTGEAILDTLVDAKGDLIVATAADTVARLAVGANGTVPRADSNATPGITWAPSPVPWGNWIPASGKIETMPRYLVGGGAVGIPTGTLRLLALPTPLLAGVTYTSISFISNGGASVPTNWWFCLVNKADMKTLRSTADQTTTAWGGTELRTVNLSSTYTPTTDIDAYVGIMMKATTPVTFRILSMQTIMYITTPLFNATANTGMTTPLSDGTTVGALTGVAEFFYGIVS